jgi:hypothetical protein
MPKPVPPTFLPFPVPLRGLAVFVLLALTGCAAPTFRYTLHTPPRIHVHHEPLLPGPEEAIRIVAVAEPAPGDTVREISISFGGDGHPFARRTCSATPCTQTFAAGHRSGLGIYSAQMTDSRGRTTGSASAYYFQIGSATSSSSPNVILRAPFDLYVGQRALKVLLVRNEADYPSQDAVRADAQTLLYDGLLADPIYRWRDNQIAVYLSAFPGSTSDYYSGLTNRCGQLPWLGRATESFAESAASTADAVVVLHRQSGWRDCAGLGVAGAGAGIERRASADGRRPETFAHELGHALFGLADEYQESTGDRTARSVTGPLPAACDCCSPSATGPPCLGRPPCGFDLPPECFRALPVCPPIASSCPRPNVFDSNAACETAKTEIDRHPGVEERTTALTCRRLCAGASCPCLEAGSTTEIWILDRRTPALPAPVPPDDDLMGTFDLLSPREQYGPACARCAESRFCLAWEIGRGRPQAEAETLCLLP